MSTADQWLDFEKEWLLRLDKKGLREFHRTELRHHRHAPLLRDLARIIQGHAMRKFGMVVRVRELHKRVPKAQYDGFHMDAYSYAGRACAGFVRLWAKKEHLRTLPELIFATGDTGRHQLEERLRADGFSGYRFQPALEVKDRKTGLITPPAVPLQAADFLAYELFDPIRRMEETGVKQGSFGRDQLSEYELIMDKVPGEPRVTEDYSLDTFKERIENFSGDKSQLIRLATWVPK